MNEISIERVREVVSYDPITGEFRWLATRCRRFLGKLAGGVDRGYISIRIDGHLYRGHRLAFLLMTGKWPTLGIDHIDGNPSNNRWANLREANQSFNRANSRRSTRNTSGFKGVSWRRGKWRAQLGLNNQTVYLGIFDTAEEAHAAYVAAAVQHFAEFARAA